MTITSQHNEKLKEIRKLGQRRRTRDRQARFVAEGEDLLAAADAAGWVAVEQYCAAGSGLPGIEVEPRLLAAASSLGSGTRALAIYEERWQSAPTGPLCIYLHGVRDPGNIGTVLRSAQAFGASSVTLGPGCADPYGPKAVRASMGALFGMALAHATDPRQLPGERVALATNAGRDLRDLELTEPTRGVTLLIGAEREGLPAHMIEACDHVARIPIQTHSLNAAMAATVALYEVSRMARA
jgi:TrmH family RNA methyltransferase